MAGQSENRQEERKKQQRLTRIVCGEWALYGVMGEGLRVTEGF